MRKRLVTIGFVVALALGAAGPVHQASAAPNENANCQAKFIQWLAQSDGQALGAYNKSFATNGGLGQYIGPGASTNTCGG